MKFSILPLPYVYLCVVIVVAIISLFSCFSKWSVMFKLKVYIYMNAQNYSIHSTYISMSFWAG